MKSSQETIFVAAGEKIELFSRSFSSVPMDYEFNAKAVGSLPLSGQLEIQSKQILFSVPVKTNELKSVNHFKASFLDTFMRVYVVADCDMEITMPERVIKSSMRPLWMVAVLILIMAVSAFVSSGF